MSILLFDLFGVIARQQSEHGRARLEAVARMSGPEFWHAYWEARPAYDRGDRSDGEYWRAVGDALGQAFTDRQTAELVAADTASWSGVDQDMVGFVNGLAADGRRLGLLSNVPEVLAADYERRHRWLDVFAVRGFSCRIGYAKPEADAYTWCCRALDAPPAEVLFIDDRRENVEAAVAAGLRGHLFTSLHTLRSALATDRRG
ncbi:MAG TPA: HAD family phosphatase [Mycobacteriales bacterium]